MQAPDAVRALSALAQDSRLAVFRALVRAGPDGLAAGEIARRLGIAPSTLSSHLTLLDQAGLVSVRRDGRSMIYAARFQAMSALIAFLVEDCCGGAAEVCLPVPACAVEA